MNGELIFGAPQEAARVSLASSLYVGHVMHARRTPRSHFFQYPVYFYALDLDELSELHRRLPLFSYNRRNIVSIHDCDYLSGSGSIKKRLLGFLQCQGLRQDVERVTLVTSARYFNYVFNPVSFYYCFNRHGDLSCAVAEVNNTFGERHLYVLPDPKSEEGGFIGRAAAPKAFHVSPFYGMEGDYDFYFSKLGKALDIRINMSKEGRTIFRSRLWGNAKPLETGPLLSVLMRYPLSASLTMPRILWQAARLKFQKRLKVFAKPYAASEFTIRAEAPGFLQRATSAVVLKFFERLERGRLKLTLPERRTLVFGKGSGIEAEMTVGNWAFFRRLLLSGDIGLGESFQEGEWTSPDLPAVLEMFGDNLKSAPDREVGVVWLGRALNRLRHFRNANSLRGSRRNIKAHYDLGNDFYALFLGDSWMYSSAVFASDGEPLEDAQRRKIDMILDKASLHPGQRVLEIGTGWGSLAMQAARRGCFVTSLTLSQEQLKLARKRARAAGLAQQVEFKLCDYRRIEGIFDRVISVEMLEAVGHENLGRWFSAVDRALAPGGRAVVQVISVPDERYESYRRGCDWIQKHIFPGALCPSLGALQAAMSAHSRLQMEHVENIGLHYAATLRAWRKRLLAQVSRIKALGFDDKFLRTWDYYFSYCEAGFRARLINNYQLVLQRAEREAS